MTSKHFAILIGINVYTKPLKGCVNDVRQIERYLRALPVYVQIQSLIAAESPNQPTSESHSADDNPTWPTYENVKCAFHATTTSAQAGDYVYIHFSGHGTRANPIDVFSNTSTGDLALVLLENGTGSQEQYLRGAELASWLEGMVDKGLVVTVVLDCCFSAAVYRYDDPSVRYLRYNAEVDRRHPHPPGLNESIINSSASRDVSMLPSWLIDPDRYAVLVACGPDQEAKELQTEDKRRHGILSFFLLETWRRFGGVRRKMKSVYHQLCAECRDAGCRQHPILYGNKEQDFFGDEEIKEQRVLIGLSPTPDGGFLIQAGLAHGVSIGDEFSVFLLDDVGFHGKDRQVFHAAKATRVRGLTADLELLDARNNSDQITWAAEAYSKSALRRCNISVSTSVQHRDNLSKAFQARGFSIVSDMEEQQAQFQITSTDEGGYTILDRSGHKVPNLPELREGDVNIEDLCDMTEHLTRYETVQELTNKTSSESFTESFEAYITNRTTTSYPGDIAKAKSGEIHELSIRNKADQNLYVFVYYLGASWQIQNLLRGTYEVLPPKNTSIGFSGCFKKRLKMIVPPEMIAEGIHECQDFIKVIVTARPTSFDLLELPKLGESLEPRKSDRTGQGDEVYPSDDWAALTFAVHTFHQQ